MRGERAGEPPDERRATTADVLEAVHRATGLPLVADFYTRLYKREDVSVKNQPLFDALHHLADAMHMRGEKGGADARVFAAINEVLPYAPFLLRPAHRLFSQLMAVPRRWAPRHESGMPATLA